MRRAAIITGASRGIGHSFALALAEAGYNLCLTGMRDHARLTDVQQSLSARFGVDRIIAVRGDAADPGAAEAAVQATLGAFGRLDILINNAGRGPREISELFVKDPPKFWETDPDAWSEIVRSNVNGPFVMARAAAPHMITQGWGRIVGISTSRVTMVRQGFAPYGPTKAALDTMTRIFAQDLAGTGVTCNILLPGGPTDTDFIPKGGAGRYRALLPVHVMNEALLWLLSEEADDITAARVVGSKWNHKDKWAAREDIGAPPLIL